MFRSQSVGMLLLYGGGVIMGNVAFGNVEWYFGIIYIAIAALMLLVGGGVIDSYVDSKVKQSLEKAGRKQNESN